MRVRTSKIVAERPAPLAGFSAKNGIGNRPSYGKKIRGAECRGAAAVQSDIGPIRGPQLDEAGLCNDHGDDLRKRLEAALNIRSENCHADATRAAESQMSDWDVFYFLSAAHWPDVL